MTTPTPAHQAFREKRADLFDKHDASDHTVKSYRAFLAGMEAEHEVARLMGRISGLWDGHANCGVDSPAANDIERQVRKAEAQLAALLEGK